MPTTEKLAEDAKLVAELGQVHWPITHGTIEVRLRDGKIATVAVERTIKADMFSVSKERTYPD